VILEIDCGNTRVKWRLRDGESIKMRGAFLTQDGFSANITNELADASIERVLVGSVVGEEYAKRLAAWSISKLGINPEFAASEISCGSVVNGYQQPEKLGVDRWLAILAARSKSADSCVIVDCGSAITVDLVTGQGEHLGGYIAPGLRLMRHALESQTVGIKFGQIGYPEGAYPGRNTVVAIKSAEMAMIIGLVEHAKNVLRVYDTGSAAVYVTGGDGEWLAAQIKGSYFIEDLVLDGLFISMPAQTGVVE
jgi:type III pantothenate kinase